MKIFILEDEKAALRHLKALLAETSYPVEIVGEADSVADGVEWLQHYGMPELMLMDIHLADRNAFRLFEQVNVTSPVIFTTAYDEYMLQAFKVNSIDYLLKPIDRSSLQQALDKYARLYPMPSKPVLDYQQLLELITNRPSYQQHFLIPAKGDRFIPLSVQDILYFYIDNTQVKAVDEEGNEWVFPQTMDQLTGMLDPMLFYRANRQYLVHRRAIREVALWFGGRLSVHLKVPTSDRILISKAKVNEFKEWLVHA